MIPHSIFHDFKNIMCEEILNLTNLIWLDIGFNDFDTFPEYLLKLPKIKRISN